jgi:predicted nucleotidyltransferase
MGMLDVPTMRSQALRERARIISAEYKRRTNPAAVLLVGSAAEGLSDEYSDLDMVMYYAELPLSDDLDFTREALGAAGFDLLAPRTDSSVIETFDIGGLDCQVIHMTVAAWEQQMDSVLLQHDAASLVQKALDGLLHGIPLLGEELIGLWQEKASAYPDGLQVAMIRNYMNIRPIWLVADRMATRDADIFLSQMRIDACLGILGTLAGLNRRYFASFQFKRMHRFLKTLTLAPANCAERLTIALDATPLDSAPLIEQLAADTLALVADHAPQIDLTGLRNPPFKRLIPWDPAAVLP